MLSEGRKLGTNGLININSYCTHFIRLAGWQLSGVATGWMKIFPGVNFQGGNYPRGKFPGGSFRGWELSGWEFSWVRFVQVGLILGGNFLWWKLFVWELSGGNHPRSNFHVTNFQIAVPF